MEYYQNNPIQQQAQLPQQLQGSPGMQGQGQGQGQQFPQVQVQQPTRPPPQQQQQQQGLALKKPSQQVKVSSTKLSNLHLAIIGAFLFFIFANPEVFSIVNRILPGVIQDYAGKVSQTGTITHAIAFGAVFYGVIYFVQRPTIEGYY
jgi:hypothetical protein